MPTEDEWVVDDAAPSEQIPTTNGTNGTAPHPPAQQAAQQPRPRPAPKPEPKNPPRGPPQYTGDAAERYDQLLSQYAPDDITIPLKRLTPPDPGGMTPKLGTIDGSAVRSGEALTEYVKTNFHMRARVRAPAEYHLSFRVKSLGQYVTVGTLQFPHQDELTEYAMAGAPPYGQPPQGRYAPPGYAYPPPYAPPYGYAPPPQGFGALQPQPAQQPAQQPPQAPTAQQAQPGPGASYEAQQLAFVSGQLQQALEYLRQTGMPLPPGLGAPAPVGPATSADELANAVIAKLAAMGLLTRPGQPAPVAAPVGLAAPVAAVPVVPPPPPMQVFRDALKIVSEFADIGSEMKVAGKRVAATFADPVAVGVAAPAAAEADEPEKPEDMLPWSRVKMGDGYEWAIDKDTGETSPMGVVASLLNNEKVANKALEFGKEALEVLKKFGQKPGLPGAAPPPAIGTGAPEPPKGTGGWWGA